jgi:AcrR family transcriptional regulator
LYEHFPSKEALYRAVLRRLIRDQDRLVATLAVQGPGVGNGGAEGIVTMLHSYFTACIRARAQDQDVTAHRLLLASLTDDGTYARLIYRRVLRNNVKDLSVALDKARENGELCGEPISAATAAFLIEHVGSMMLSTHLSAEPVAPYGEAGAELVRKAVFFCGRGLGLSDAVIAGIYTDRLAMGPG